MKNIQLVLAFSWNDLEQTFQQAMYSCLPSTENIFS